MKNSIHFFLTFVFYTFFLASTFCQLKPQSYLKKQAIVMGQAFLNADYKTFARYNYPPLVKAMGGEVKMAETLKKSMDELTKQGMGITQITFGEPTKIITVGKELQCTITQHTNIKQVTATIQTTSTLIAVSNDKGVNWKFLDTTNKDIETIRKLMPNLSKEIIVPLQKPPVKIT